MNELLFSNVKTLLFFQIMLAQWHKIKSLASGLAELLKALPKMINNIYFIIIVPEDCMEHYFKAQPVLDSGTISPTLTKLYLK